MYRNFWMERTDCKCASSTKLVVLFNRALPLTGVYNFILFLLPAVSGGPKNGPVMAKNVAQRANRTAVLFQNSTLARCCVMEQNF